MPGEIVRGHEFHYSDFIPETPAVMACRGSRWSRVTGMDRRLADSSNTFASYLHVHSCPASGNVAALAGGGEAHIMTILLAYRPGAGFIIGDQHWPQPVRWIGRLITFVQRIARRYCPGDKALRIGGAVMWVVVVGATWGVAWAYWRWRSGFTPGLAERRSSMIYHAGRTLPACAAQEVELTAAGENHLAGAE